MRYAIWCGLLLVGVVSGCRQQATENPEKASARAQSEPGHDMPAESAPNGAPAEKQLRSSGSVVELDAIILTAPSDWTRTPTSSPIIAAEFKLPRAAGDDADGRLTVSTAGGSIEANIDRWKDQFQPQPTAAKQDVIDVSGWKVTIVDLSGDFNDQRGPFAPAQKRLAYRMIAAVIPASGQLYFVKTTGPEKTIALHADEIQQFIRSARLRKS